jgi:DNA-binding CsgD family transcriptional regulator/PAS domain-containing protein
MNRDVVSHDAERLSEVIGAIYDCVLDPGRWEPTLDDLRRFLDCANCVAAVLDLRSGALRMRKVIGIEPYWLARMGDYGADLAALYQSSPDILTRPIDEPLSPSRDASHAAYMGNRMYREWARPQGLVDSVTVLVMRNHERLAEVGLGRHESVGLITNREIGLMRLLAPHLRRAVTISDLLDMKSIEAESLGGVLDEMAVGVLLVAEDGTILHANRAAAGMLDRRNPIATIGGKIGANDPRAASRLRRFIALAAGRESEIGASGIGIALRDGSDAVATAHILPLARGEVRTRLLSRAVAAVFVTSDTQLPLGRLDAFAEAFGLTPAETRLLGRLIRGESIDEASAALNVARTTSKTHISRILAKTGTRGRPALMALVYRLAPALRPGPPAS